MIATDELVVLICAIVGVSCSRTPLETFQQHLADHQPHNHHHHHRPPPALPHPRAVHKKKLDAPLPVLYQWGVSSEDELPECAPLSVCNKVDLYDSPWLEKKCRCPGQQHCPTSTAVNDGFTILDKHRQYKMCESVKKLPKCRFFRDITWTFIVRPSNLTEQIVHCHCPKNAVIYLTKPHTYYSKEEKGIEHRYHFACSPQNKIRCQRKEPCRLFSVRKRLELLDDVNVSSLCQCPHAHRCPHHHTDYGVIPGKNYVEESIRTYSGYCVPN